MKKNKCLKLLVVVFIALICCGCNGDVTRGLRGEGFQYNDKDFKCSPFFKNGKNEAVEKIKFFTDSYFINEEGKIYEMSLSNQFSSLENCREAQTSIMVKAIMDDVIVKGYDNKYYSLTNKSEVAAYSEIPATDNNYLIYQLLLLEDNVLKVSTVDSNAGLYYSLRTDGNIYAYTIKKGDKDKPPTITSSSIAYNQNDYGERIVDFNYAGDSSATMIKLESGKVFRMEATNKKDCSKYLDIPCNYEMIENTTLTKYADKIIAYNGKIVITDYHKYFTLSGK